MQRITATGENRWLFGILAYFMSFMLHSGSLKPVRTVPSSNTTRGSLDQHTVGSQQLQLLLFCHGGKLILQTKIFIDQATGIEEFFQRQTAGLVPLL